MTSVELTAVSVAYDRCPVVKDVACVVPSRSWVGLIGPNGAGKTTLLRAVAGLVTHEGSLRIGEVETRRIGRRRLSQLIAYLPQRPVVPDGMTVVDYVSIGRTPYISYWGSESMKDRTVVAQTLERLELVELADRAVSALSGGETQRAALARALAQQSDVLLLDEPTSSLDVGHAQQVLELIDQLRAERGLTVIAALHDLTLAGQFADRLVMLSSGRVVGEGTPRSVLTEESIERHYGARVRVLHEADAGLTVIPVRSKATTRPTRSLPSDARDHTPCR